MGISCGSARLVADKFFSKIRKTDTCWFWTGYKDKLGRGEMRIRGRTVRAHVVSYMIHHGEVPAGKFVCHTCDVHGCVNPDHLYAGSPHDNHRDMIERGRYVGNTKVNAGEVKAYAIGRTQAEVARRFGISQTGVSYILRKR